MFKRIPLFVILVLGAWVLGLTTPSETPAYDVIEVKDGGTVSGVVKFAGEIPAPEQLNIDKDPEVCGHEPRFSENLTVDKSTKAVANAVVYIQKIDKGKKFPTPSETEAMKGIPPGCGAEEHAHEHAHGEEKQEYTLNQKSCAFIPHVQVIPAGSAVELRNGDPLMHNLHSYSMKNSAWNESIPGDGKPIHKEFPFREAVKVGCDVHKWMSAWIVLQDNPYYYLTGEDGTFKIADIPPGAYKLAVWHEDFKKETLKAQTKDVNIETGKEATVNFELSK